MLATGAASRMASVISNPNNTDFDTFHANREEDA
jgi:hypothetical protein